MRRTLYRRQWERTFPKNSKVRYPTLFALLFPCIASAQYDAILADTSITWAAVFEMTLPIDPLVPYFWNEEFEKMTDLSILKLQSDDQSLLGYTHHSLNALIWIGLGREDWEYFDDAALTRPLTFDEMVSIVSAPDTVMTFDPETYEEKLAVVWDAHHFPYECPLLRTRQILTYNNLEAKFEIIPLAIAPAQPDGSVQFIWIKFPTTDQVANFDLDSPDINWAIRYISKNESPRFADFKVIKGAEKSIAERLFERLAPDTTVALYTIHSDNLLSASERNNIFLPHTDTVVTFDPETYEEKLKILPGGYRPEDIVDIQLIEEWIWDKKQQLPFMRLRGVVPRFITEQGWHEAIFYLKTSE